MTSPGSRSRMTLRAKLERFTHTEDQYNQVGKKTWTTKTASLVCWAWSLSRSEVFDQQKVAVVESLKMIVPLGTSIDERDRVNGIKDRDDNVIFSGIFGIEAVQRKPGHVEVTLSGAEGQQS